MARITIEEFNEIVRTEMPFAADVGLSLEEVERGRAVVRLPFDESSLRPGGTVSGPTMMLLADATMYAVVLSCIGIVKLAVTTSFNINFLHRPEPADLIAEGRALKIGRRLAVIDVTVHSDGFEAPVAHATGTYSIPPNGR